MLTRLKMFDLSVEDLVTIYVGFVLPLLEYVVHIGIWVSQRNNTRLKSIFRRGHAESSWVVTTVVTKMPTSFITYLILEADMTRSA